ncbi:hypothetical protein HJD18_02130 [Thermoleophilia bacterium SCSIO 60948]|nr:hypothetical protein HJD18_02130 [Thermoleophilia bacterium SCSIO 60948]
MAPPSDRPILAVDVDGVISLFGFEGPLDQVPGRFRLIDGIAHCISNSAGELLNRLGARYELIWATGWEDRANDMLPDLLGLPGPLHTLTFDGRARFGTAHWKLEALDEYAGNRPLAWIDDSLDGSCRDWASSRGAPTLLVQTASDMGIQEQHVEELEDWADRLRRPDTADPYT